MTTRRTADAADVSPTAQRWELAKRLKELRTQHGKSLEDVARELMCSTAKVSRMETGARGIQRRDVRDLCRYYKVTARTERELMTLAEEAGQPGWWSEFRSLNDETAAFVGLESAAVESWISNLQAIPGLFQTERYSEALLRSIKPKGEITPDAQSEGVQLRQRRQERLTSGAIKVRAIVDESALVRRVTSLADMAAQLERLIERARLPNVTLQVVPFSAGAHPGLDGSFHYLRFAPGTIADVVFVEGHLGMFLTDKPADTERYRAVFEETSERYALTPDATLQWLEARRESLLHADSDTE